MKTLIGQKVLSIMYNAFDKPPNDKLFEQVFGISL